MTKLSLSLALVAIIALSGCKDRGVNFFSLQQDMDFGDSLVTTIANDPSQYPVLSRTANPEAYEYIEGMMTDILTSDKFKYNNRFNWQIYIINEDVLNAFAAPGGKLYFYTGLINYLDDAASLAGVMGHEMAHADLRHSTQAMTKTYGLGLLLDILMGDNQSQMEGIVSDMALGLGQLKFSRENEYDADRYSMYYLASTKYDPRGISSFFVKMQSEGKTKETLPWLSTHPSDQDRIDAANKVYSNDSELKSRMAGKTYDFHKAEYEAFKALLK